MLSNVPNFCWHVQHQRHNRGIFISVDDKAHLFQSSPEISRVLCQLLHTCSPYKRTEGETANSIVVSHIHNCNIRPQTKVQDINVLLVLMEVLKINANWDLQFLLLYVTKINHAFSHKSEGTRTGTTIKSKHCLVFPYQVFFQSRGTWQKKRQLPAFKQDSKFAQNSLVTAS